MNLSTGLHGLRTTPILTEVHGRLSPKHKHSRCTSTSLPRPRIATHDLCNLWLRPVHGRSCNYTCWRAKSRQLDRRTLSSSPCSRLSMFLVSAVEDNTCQSDVAKKQPRQHARKLRVLFAAGGTGGHVFPAIAIAEAVKKLVRTEGSEVEIHFVGTEQRMEWETVPKAGYPIHAIPAVSLQRRLLSVSNLALPFRLLWAIVRSCWLVLRLRPHVVVGTGGYVSLPTCAAAALFRRPVVLQEQNAFAGLANRVLACVASVAFVAFPEAASAFKDRCRVEVSGNPTRSSLSEPLDQSIARSKLLQTLPWGRDHSGRGDQTHQPNTAPSNEQDAAWLVVLGGSLGAASINAVVQEALAAGLLSRPDEGSRPICLIWQTGARYFADASKHVDPHPNLAVVPFLDCMDLVYASSDLVVGRSGAITCSELLTCSVPSILIPSPNVTADHQRVNAQAMKATGATLVLDENDLTVSTFKDYLQLLQDQNMLHNMREAAKKSSRTSAADTIAKEVLDLCIT